MVCHAHQQGPGHAIASHRRLSYTHAIRRTNGIRQTPTRPHRRLDRAASTHEGGPALHEKLRNGNKFHPIQAGHGGHGYRRPRSRATQRQRWHRLCSCRRCCPCRFREQRRWHEGHRTNAAHHRAQAEEKEDRSGHNGWHTNCANPCRESCAERHDPGAHKCHSSFHTTPRHQCAIARGRPGHESSSQGGLRTDHHQDHPPRRAHHRSSWIGTRKSVTRLRGQRRAIRLGHEKERADEHGDGDRHGACCAALSERPGGIATKADLYLSRCTRNTFATSDIRDSISSHHARAYVPVAATNYRRRVRPSTVFPILCPNNNGRNNTKHTCQRNRTPCCQPQQPQPRHTAWVIKATRIGEGSNPGPRHHDSRHYIATCAAGTTEKTYNNDTYDAAHRRRDTFGNQVKLLITAFAGATGVTKWATKQEEVQSIDYVKGAKTR